MRPAAGERMKMSGLRLRVLIFAAADFLCQDRALPRKAMVSGLCRVSFLPTSHMLAKGMFNAGPNTSTILMRSIRRFALY